MSDYTPIVLGFETLSSSRGKALKDVALYLASQHHLKLKTILSAGRLIFDEHYKWTDTSLIKFQPSLHEALDEIDEWVKVSSQIAIGGAFYPISLFVVPAMAAGVYEPDLVCVNLKLGSKPYETVFGFRDRDDGRYDEEAKRGLLKLSVGTASALASRTFMLSFEEAEFEAWTISETMQRLLAPELTLRGKRPGLLTGISSDLIDIEQLRAVWGESDDVYETSGGFLVFDDLTQSMDDTT